MTSRLSHELIQDLAPLLGSLARMTARGSDLSKEQLQIVLEGAGLETHAETLTELVRWTRLLDRVRTQPSMQVREAVVEALLLRGLPEATVLLAVDTVADNGQPVSPPNISDKKTIPAQLSRLIVSRKTLDFGTVSGCISRVVTLTVEGGPGRVVVESDQVLVCPTYFQSGETRLQVEVKPLATGVLWTSMKLITAAETLEIPIIVQWDIANAPSSDDSTPSSEPQADLVVDPNGSGTHRTLVEAVAVAAEGSIIHLRRGTHILEEGMMLRHALTLVGEGIDLTEIVSAGGRAVLTYRGNGRFTLRNLSLRREGMDTEVVNCVSVQSGESQIAHCRFSGAVSSSDTAYSAGIEIRGRTLAEISSCEAHDNDIGICVGEYASVTLKGNTCQYNLRSGVLYYGNTMGTVYENTCRNNGASGIELRGQSQPILEGNICQDNKKAGIAYFDNAQGTARGNTCIQNEWHGVVVRGQAKPILENNICKDNKQGGGAYFQELLKQIDAENEDRRRSTSNKSSRLSAIPSSSMQNHLEKLEQAAEDAVRANDFDTAAKHLAQAISHSPGKADLHAALASIYFRQGHISGAREQWLHVLALDPQYKDAHQQLAHCYTQLARFDAASEVLEHALRDPSRRKDPVLYRTLAIAYHKQNRLDEAIWALDQAQSLDFDPKLAALRSVWQK